MSAHGKGTIFHQMVDHKLDVCGETLSNYLGWCNVNLLYLRDSDYSKKSSAKMSAAWAFKRDANMFISLLSNSVLLEDVGHIKRVPMSLLNNLRTKK